MSHWVYDFETLPNCFVAVFEDYKKEERKIFRIDDYVNDYQKFLSFLESCKDDGSYHIGFNNISFDSQITEYLIRNEAQYSLLSGSELSKEIKKHANYVITKSNNNEWLDFAPYEFHINQIDLYKLNHWNNPNKRASLKWIQFSMDWEHLEDMPIEHDYVLQNEQEVQMVINYCINDVASTKKILHISKDQIDLRASLTEEYKINLYSAAEPTIAKSLFALFLANKTGQKVKDIKKNKTILDRIEAKPLLLPYLKFNDPEFKNVLNVFNNLVIDPNNTKGSLSVAANYKGSLLEFGLGGLHGATNSGVYESDSEYVIMSSDVVSYYPNLAIRNKWAPAHMPKKEFCELYEWFFDERRKIPKTDPRNYTYKIVLNSTYGLSNDRHSFLYDPSFTMRITLNGQLSLTLLLEMICEAIPEAQPLLQNTDGLETKIPRKYKKKYLEVCAEWEKLTLLELEHDTYKKLIISDVNSYIAVKTFKEVSKEKYSELKIKDPIAVFKELNGTYYYASTKCKGRFEFENLALHKNKSGLVIRKAIYNYFVHGVIPENYLPTNKNIFDYCLGVRQRNKDWKFYIKSAKTGEIEYKLLQKTLRYFISISGDVIVKVAEDGRENRLEAGIWKQTIYNQVIEKKWADYKIDERYYISSIYKEINNIILENKKGQFGLF